MAVIVAIGAVVIVGMVGLAIDGGLSYMNRTTLQGAADTASQAGARMLGADYGGSQQSPPLPPPPFSFSLIESTVQTDLQASSAGPTAAKVFSAFLVTTDTAICPTPQPGSVPSSGSGQCLVCQFFPVGSTTPPIPQCPGIPEAADGSPLVDGVEVVPTNTNATPFLGVLGINQASQSANATSTYGLVSGLASPPYVVWYDCFSTSSSGPPPSPTNEPPQIGDYVTYFDNKGGKTKGYQPDAACGDQNDTNASFSGDLHNTWPSPALVPGWINANGGVDASTLTPIKAGSDFLLPFVDCVGKDTSFPFTTCTNSLKPSECGPTFSPTPPVGEWDLCIVGYVYVQAVNDCGGYGSSNSSTKCIGEVIAEPNAPAGTIVCEPSPLTPSCGNLLDGRADPIVIQLYH